MFAELDRVESHRQPAPAPAADSAPVEPPRRESGIIPTLTRVITAREPVPGEGSSQPTAETNDPVIDELVAEYLPRLEQELRRRLREQLREEND